MAKRRKSCRRKYRHETREEAVRELRRLMRDKFASITYMHAYHCNHCDGFHVGHRIGTEGKSRR